MNEMRVKLLKIQNSSLIHKTEKFRTNLVPRCIRSMRFIGEVFEGDLSEITCPDCLEKLNKFGMKMNRILFCILFCNSLAFAETPQNVDDYLHRFEVASLRNLGFRYPGQNRTPKFKLGLSPFLPQDKNLGHNWWFAQSQMDGECDRTSNNSCQFVIAFDTLTWQKSDDLYREILFFHEMGHCVLLLPHDASEMVARKVHYAFSVMHPEPISQVTYLLNRDLYHERFFASTKNKVEKIRGIRHVVPDHSRRFNLARSSFQH